MKYIKYIAIILFGSLLITGCYFPEKFTSSVDIHRDGSYTMEYKGTMINILTIGEKLTLQDNKNLLEDAIKIRKDPEVKEIRYLGSGKYYIHMVVNKKADQRGYIFGEDIAIIKAIPRKNKSLQIFVDNISQSDISILRKYHVNIEGRLVVSIPEGYEVKGSNADRTPKVFGLFGNYEWDINSFDKKINILLMPKNFSKDMFKAITNGDINLAEKLLEQGADVNSNKGALMGETILEYSLQMNSIEIANLLIDKGADVNKKALISKLSALHYGVSTDNKKIVEKLLKKDADVDARNFDGINPPICNANYEIAKLLIKYNSKTDVLCSKRAENEPLIIRAVRKNRYNLTKLLLDSNNNLKRYIEKLLNIAKDTKLKQLLIEYANMDIQKQYKQNIQFQQSLNLKIENKKIYDKACIKANKDCIEIKITYPFVNTKEENITNTINNAIKKVIYKDFYRETAKEFIESSLKQGLPVYDFEQILNIELGNIKQNYFILHYHYYSYLGQPRPVKYGGIIKFDLKTGREIKKGEENSKKSPNQTDNSEIVKDGHNDILLKSSDSSVASNNYIELRIHWKQEGDWIRINLDAKNLLGNARGGISISFPDLKDKDHSIRLIRKSGNKSLKAYSQGSKIWHRGLRRAISSNDLLVEGWDKHWRAGEINSISFNVHVKDLNNLKMNVRSVLIKNRYEYMLPQSSNVYDQQGYPVKQISIELNSNKNSNINNSYDNFKFNAKNSYIAKISNRDHYNSRGIRLTKAIDILRQDRANYSKYIRDDEDTYSNYFTTLSERNKMSRYAVKAVGISYDKLKNLIINSNPVLKIEVKNKTLHVSLVDKRFLENYFLTKEEKISLLKQILNRKYIKKDPLTNGDIIIKPAIRNYLANVKFKDGIKYSYTHDCKKIDLNLYECHFSQLDSDGEDESSISIYYKAIKKNNKIIFDKIEKYFMAD